MVRFNGFEWDNGNLKKVQKHGLSIDEIESIFRQKVFVIEDHNHSENENRWIAVGLSKKDRPMFVSYTIRRPTSLLKIRVISARYMHKKEVAEYEKLKKRRT